MYIGVSPFNRVDFAVTADWYGEDGVGIIDAPENETEEEKEQRRLDWRYDIADNLGRKIDKIREEIRAWIAENIEE